MHAALESPEISPEAYVPFGHTEGKRNTQKEDFGTYKPKIATVIKYIQYTHV